MNPFYFGDDKSQLYGVLHPASGADFKDECIVLCHPFGQEYERAHRAFRNLATNLSARGYEVLRFDYFGTGDSSGDSEQVDLDLWKSNILTAIDEVKDCSGIDSVSLIGLRLGGSLVLSVASEVEGLKRCVAWDPLVSGDAFFEEIRNYLEPQYLSIVASQASEDMVFLNGYPLPASFRKQLRSLKVDGFKVGDGVQYTVVASHENDNFSNLVKYLAGQNKESKLSLIPCEADWNYSGGDGGILLPQPILAGITELFS